MELEKKVKELEKNNRNFDEIIYNYFKNKRLNIFDNNFNYVNKKMI